MGSVTDYQSRAKHCAERAQTVTGKVDRARWLQLAEQWDALSRVQLPTTPARRNELAGLWRGEPPRR